MKMNRRDFLIYSRNITLTSFLSNVIYPFSVRRALASPTAGEIPHFFVLLRVDGGMDVTLGLDPKNHRDGTEQTDIFIEYREEDIKQTGNLLLGPAAISLSSHFQDILVVNGINMRRDAGHESLSDYISCGSGNGKTAILPIEIAATKSIGPLGVLVDDSVPTGTRKIVMSSSDEIIRDNNEGAASIGLLGAMDKSPNIQSGFGMAQSGLLSAKGPMDEVKILLETYKEKHGSESLDKYLAAAVSFVTGLCQQAVLNVADGDGIVLDTHSNHEDRHLRSQALVWDKVSEIFSLFKSFEYKDGSLFDYTTFMVSSEFSRTPFLNPAKGKDHNPYTNSVLLAGKNVNGNSTIGGSHVIKGSKTASGDALHISTPIDFSNGSLINRKEDRTNETNIIFPENLARTVASLFDDPEGFSNVDLASVRSIPNVKKIKF